MTDAELEAERLALLAEEQELADAHERLQQRPDDRAGHRAHGGRLRADTERVRAFQAALLQRHDTRGERHEGRWLRVGFICR